MSDRVEQPRRVNIELVHETMRVKRMLEEATAMLGTLVSDLREQVEEEEDQQPEGGGP